MLLVASLSRGNHILHHASKQRDYMLCYQALLAGTHGNDVGSAERISHGNDVL